MGQSFHTSRWLWGVGIGLGLIAITGVCVFLVKQNRTSTNSDALEISKPRVVGTPLSPTVDSAVAESPPQIPHLDFPAGSIEGACGVNEFPLYWVAYEEGTRVEVHKSALESVECQTALENSIKTVNPYLWGART